ncbi:MAG: PAS domain-containing protein [Saprospiraceae bacterium]|nr:PAS domain-containing protein [Saprospiraceae bacterium]
MKVLQRILNNGISGDLTSLQRLARQIFNFDLIMGIVLPMITVIYYEVNGLTTPVFLAGHLFIVAFFGSCIYFVSKGYYEYCVWKCIGFIYIMMLTIVLAYSSLFNSIFFVPLSLNALIYFPERKRISISILVLFLVTGLTLFLMELSLFSFQQITRFQVLNMKAALAFFTYLFAYKIVSFLLMYWRTISTKEASEEGVKQFLKLTAEGIYHISFTSPIPTNLPIEEQYVRFRQDGYFLQCNDAFARLYGYEEGKVVSGMPINKFVAGIPDAGMAVTFPDFAAANYIMLNKASREWNEKGEYVHLLNNVFGIVENSQLKGIWGTQRDISELKATQDTIATRDEITEKLMANFPVVYYRFDKDLNFTLSVGGALQRLGLKPNEVVGANMKEIYKHVPEIIEGHQAVIDGKDNAFLTKVPNQKEELFFDTRVTFDPKKEEGIGFALETTERKIAENALLKSENRYRNLFNSTFDAIFIFNTESGLVEECNENARTMFEIPEEADIQTLSPIYMTPQYQPDGTLSSKMIEQQISGLASKKRLQFEFFHKRFGGEMFETETTLIPSSFNSREILVIINDVSTRRQAERALRTRERQLREAQKVALLGSWEYDYTADAFSCSQQLHQMFEMGNLAHAGYMTCIKLLVAEEYQDLMAEVKRDNNRSTFNFTYNKKLGTGEHKWFQMTGEKSFDKEGRAARISGIVQDITTQHNQEEIIRKALKALNEKNEDLKKYIDSNMQLENFAYMASHDLKAPIRTIVSFTQLLKRSLKDRLQDNEEEYLQYISTGANSMKNLIEDLLTYSRVNTNNHQLEEVVLPKILASIKADLQTALEDSEATIHIKNIPDSIQADSTMMRQLFQNLLENAIKFRRPEIAPEIEIGCSSTEDHWNFYIKDNGIGISPEFQEKIFLLFRKLHSSSKYEGTGIGLALCKKIVEQHGGKIWVDDKYEDGTCFQFTLRKQLVFDLVSA